MNRFNNTIFLVFTAIFQAFNGLSGLLGGFMLLWDSTGSTLGVKLEWLQTTPFENFFIPGLVLFVMNGLGNSIGFFVTILNHRRAGAIAALFGVFMMLWIIVQLAWISYQNFLQPLYFTSGLTQCLLGWWWYNQQMRSVVP